MCCQVLQGTHPVADALLTPSQDLPHGSAHVVRWLHPVQALPCVGQPAGECARQPSGRRCPPSGRHSSPGAQALQRRRLCAAGRSPAASCPPAGAGAAVHWLTGDRAAAQPDRRGHLQQATWRIVRLSADAGWKRQAEARLQRLQHACWARLWQLQHAPGAQQKPRRALTRNTLGPETLPPRGATGSCAGS